MSALRMVVNDVSAEIHAAFSAKELAASNTMVGQIAIAATGAVREAGQILKDRGRANIAAAGFSKKWQNAWRVNDYPRTGVSIDAAAFAFHKIPYASIFETGGTISGLHGKLWIALPTAPKGRGTRGSPLRMRPKQLVAQGVKLFSINRPGKKPLLAADVRNFKGGTLTLTKLRNGTKGKRGTVSAVPLFVGVDSIHERKRFDLEGVADSVRARLGELYFKHLKPE